MGWAEKLPSGRYRAVYRDGGGKRRSAGIYTHKATAVREAGAKEVTARKKMWSDPDAYKTPWDKWADEWWPTRTVEASTLARDSSRRKTHLDPRWTGVAIGAITRQDVKAWAASMRAAGTGPAVVQRCVHLLSASLAAALDAEIIEYNPAARIKLAKGQQAGERYLTDDEFEAIRRQMPTELDQLVVDTLVETGVRWGELAGLHRSRLDLKRKIARIVETYSETDGTIKGYTKSRRIRDVPLSNRLAAALKKHLEAMPAPLSCGVEHKSGKCRSGLVFTTPTGHPLRNSNWSPAWRTAVEHSGVGQVRPYDLRHTYASRLLQDGVSLAEVGKLLGHVSPQTTAIYAHLEKDPSTVARASLNRRKPKGRERGSA
jgi:integrase